MISPKKVLLVLAVTILGIWGCAKGPAIDSTSTDRLKALEVKVSKLELDLGTVTSERNTLRKKLTTAEEQRTQAVQEVQHLQKLVKERDELVLNVKSRTDERDALQVQYDQFRKNIKELLGQADAGIVKPATQPVTATMEMGTAGKL